MTDPPEIPVKFVLVWTTEPVVELGVAHVPPVTVAPSRILTLSPELRASEELQMSDPKTINFPTELTLRAMRFWEELPVAETE